jgi:hypothetical protein
MATQASFFQTIIYFVMESGFCLMLFAASIGCWRMRSYGRLLFVLYAIISMAYETIATAMQFARFPVRVILINTAQHMIGFCPFALVIILLMFHRQIRAVFRPRTS